MSDRFTITYRLATTSPDQAAEFAQALALSQTVAMPRSAVPSGLAEDVMLGHVEGVLATDDGAVEARISYSQEATSDEFSQLLQLLIGTATLRKGVRVVGLELGPLARLYPGARYGLLGIRRAVSVPSGPMLAVPLGPQGATAEELANRAFTLATAGPDMIVEQPHLSNQPVAPYFERVEKVQAAISRANAASGKRAVYCPTLPGPFDQAIANAIFARQAGVGALQVRPGLLGFDVARGICRAEEISLPIISDPSGLTQYGPLSGPGLSEAFLHGDVSRLMGADAAIIAGLGSPAGLDRQRFRAVSQACLSQGIGEPIIPAPRGPLSNDTAGAVLATYGEDVLLVLDGSIYRHGDRLGEALDLIKSLAGRF